MFTTYRGGSEDLSDGNSISFAQDESRRLWVGTISGLNELDRRTGIWKSYNHEPADPRSLSNGLITALLHHSSGDLWVGTYSGGLNRRPAGEEGFERFLPGERPGDLTSEGVMSLFEDEQATLWIGTFGGGLNRYDSTSGGFVAYRHDPDDPSSLASDRVAVVRSAGPGKLWVGTNEGGLNLLRQGYGVLSRRYRTEAGNPESLSHDSVTSILESANGDLWISTFLGVNRWTATDRREGSSGSSDTPSRRAYRTTRSGGSSKTRAVACG